MVDGAVSAVVAGPVSTMPEEWVCPLLGVDPDDFNHDTETFSAIAATLMRHNEISETLSTTPETFAPVFAQMANGEIDARPWCMGGLSPRHEAAAEGLVPIAHARQGRTPPAAANLVKLRR